MKILIAGSCNDCVETYIQFCNDIATELSKKNEIILGSDRKTTADFFVFEQLIKQKLKSKVTIFYHEMKDKPYSSFNNFYNIDVTYKKIKGNWNVARVPQISYSDIIIIIGGSSKTRKIIQLAESLGKKVIPIPTSGGVADEYWNEFKNQNKEYETDLENLENWNMAKSTKSIQNLCKKHTNKSKYKNINFISVILIGLISIISFYFWNNLLLQGKSQLELIIMPLLASLIGVNLYAIFNIIETKSLDIIEALLLRPIAAFSLAFIVVILYLVGGLSINGNLDIFTKLAESGNFQRIGLSLSLFGVFSGLMIEQSIKFIKNKISKFIDNE